MSISKSFCYSPITSNKWWVEPTEYGVHIVIGLEHCFTGCPKECFAWHTMGTTAMAENERNGMLN